MVISIRLLTCAMSILQRAPWDLIILTEWRHVKGVILVSRWGFSDLGSLSLRNVLFLQQ